MNICWEAVIILLISVVILVVGVAGLVLLFNFLDSDKRWAKITRKILYFLVLSGCLIGLYIKLAEEFCK